MSPETARDMARGVREVFRAAVGLAVTGIAGPSGGSLEKPVGTVYIGLATARGGRGLALSISRQPGGRSKS